ncbi:transporter substrate-binding domain-containing protein [Bartonella sp. HY329]|uniref:transporter substrate-binding domain-containing protein n=1 Tax=unclassified Bartonella TaxID=2645622 RepID=UPI0021C5E846|nr:MULTISPECIES: transporter substrate-binding domain-containing protein [unclassified Bartonella]UXM94501.1 transporter substrate-binding domain-containing protein [Bartonella sp. HY329]UXN08825.1 transporter substrate-binding domain-containing protein [Bartonella sp. HY328]
MKKLLLILSATALCPLTAWADSASHLDHVLENKTLRVCTTGDYKPYTFLKEDGDYTGIDVDMARSLAASLDAKVVFVPTTWKELMPDFLAGKCDIAMGGISISLERQQKVAFSDALGIDGKVPFVRCDDVEKYASVEQLNQPHVRAIEPAGGTNEKYVRKYMPKAQLELFHDNNIIFQNLVDNKADVMITDISEILYQKRFYPTLCPVNPEQQLTFAEKGYMLPRNDIVWKNYVDQWLHIAKNNGEYKGFAKEWQSE